VQEQNSPPPLAPELYPADNDHASLSGQDRPMSQQNPEINNESKSPSDEVVRLLSMGDAAFERDEFRPTIEYYGQALDLARKIGDRDGEETALDNLKRAYQRSLLAKSGVRSAKENLQISHETGNQRKEMNSLFSLAINSMFLKQADNAIEYQKRALAIARELGDQDRVLSNLHTLGMILEQFDRNSEAVPYCEEALALARQIGDRRAEVTALGWLGQGLEKTELIDRAIDCYKQQLPIYREFDQQHNVGHVLVGIGEALEKQDKIKEALQYVEEGHAILFEYDRLHMAPCNRALSRLRGKAQAY
jgi:tetratricopeptide (TPR) repeat protein